jgi:type I restriction enzyme R subunit
MHTDTSEKALESLIVAAMTGHQADAPVQPERVAWRRPTYGAGAWILGDAKEYDREYAVDLAQLAAFLRATQPEVAEALDLDSASPTRQKFLARLQGEITKRGVIEVLRHGIKHGAHDLALFYGTPTPGNARAEERYTQNRFSVTRQLRYSRDETSSRSIWPSSSTACRSPPSS